MSKLRLSITFTCANVWLVDSALSGFGLQVYYHAKPTRKQVSRQIKALRLASFDDLPKLYSARKGRFVPVQNKWWNGK